MKEEEKKGTEDNDILEEILTRLDEPTKGYILITTDRTSGLKKDVNPDEKIIMKSNLIDPLAAHVIQKVLLQLRDRGA